MKYLVLCIILVLSVPVFAQDDILKEYNDVRVKIINLGGMLEYNQNLETRCQELLAGIWSDRKEIAAKIIELQGRLKQLEAQVKKAAETPSDDAE